MMRKKVYYNLEEEKLKCDVKNKVKNNIKKKVDVWRLVHVNQCMWLLLHDAMQAVR